MPATRTVWPWPGVTPRAFWAARPTPRTACPRSAGSAAAGGPGCSRRRRRPIATMPTIAAKSRRWARSARFTFASASRAALGVALQAHALELIALTRAPPDERVDGGQALARAVGVLAQPAVLLGPRLLALALRAAAGSTCRRPWSARRPGRPAALRSGGSWVSQGMSGRNTGRLRRAAPGARPSSGTVELAEQLLARLAGRDERGGARRRPGRGRTASWRRPGGSRPTGRRTRAGTPRSTARRCGTGSRGRGSASSANGSSTWFWHEAERAVLRERARRARVQPGRASGTRRAQLARQPAAARRSETSRARLRDERQLRVEGGARRTARRAARRGRSARISRQRRVQRRQRRAGPRGTRRAARGSPAAGCPPGARSAATVVVEVRDQLAQRAPRSRDSAPNTRRLAVEHPRQVVRARWPRVASFTCEVFAVGVLPVLDRLVEARARPRP